MFTGDTSGVGIGFEDCLRCFVNAGSATVNVAGVTDKITDRVVAVLVPFAAPDLGGMAAAVYRRRSTPKTLQ